MITVHHLENSRSQRILWLLEELGVDYEIQRYERDKKTSLAPQALFDVHPLGKSPVITDDDVTVAETGAIFEYIMDQYADGRLRPGDDAAAKRAYTYWLHYAEGTIMPLMVMSLIFNKIETAPMPFFVKPIAKGIVREVNKSYLGPNLDRNLDFIEVSLSQSTWFTGEGMTAVDILMSFPIEAAAARGGLLDDRPKMKAFLTRIGTLPAYRRALERGGDYLYAAI
ncbi:MAG: glutathione S-transferase [Pseudomonadota bacterium]